MEDADLITPNDNDNIEGDGSLLSLSASGSLVEITCSAIMKEQKRKESESFTERKYEEIWSIIIVQTAVRSLLTWFQLQKDAMEMTQKIMNTLSENAQNSLINFSEVEKIDSENILSALKHPIEHPIVNNSNNLCLLQDDKKENITEVKTVKEKKKSLDIDTSPLFVSRSNATIGSFKELKQNIFMNTENIKCKRKEVRKKQLGKIF
ncbi:uncharacterized protein LOC111639902 [Centruroides sculpturatus]|uniref:uncharacterized protein LOC111639902 n=1 Tax=Centruroides sculpturatus TaxID=218467 RepID=UPI000C6D4A9D|nr:uncharacterized protein LOC111639902 [Centruroides sculpturatus]